MTFKHSFHVFVDNFKLIYKQLLYRLVVGIIVFLIGWACLIPFTREILPEINNLLGRVQEFVGSFMNGDVGSLAEISESIRLAYSELVSLVQRKVVGITLMVLLLIALYIIEKWFDGLGNYAAAAVINDRMALHADSPYIVTLIRNLKEAAIYNLIYVPLSVLYDLVIAIVLILLLGLLINSVQQFFINVFIFTFVMIIATAIKLTFTCDWLPAIIRGKMSQKQSFIYTFKRKNKATWTVFSNFIVLTLIIMSLNVAAFITTLGVGVLITIPASYLMLLCFEMVIYYDREDIKYFIDKNTIIKSDKEHIPSREEFFRGENY